ncbi:MAG: SLBB domain-containing protein [Leadbetterella sp.]
MKFPNYRKSNIIINSFFFIFLSFLLTQNLYAQSGTGTQNGTRQISSENPEIRSKTNNRKNPIRKTTGKSETDTRDLNMRPEDARAIEAEEEGRLKKEAEIEADVAKSKLIKRIFGSSIFNNTKVEIGAQTNISTPNNYVLGPGDEITIDVYGYSQFRQVSKVNSDGFIVLDKAGPVTVSGLNKEEAENKIKNSFSKVFLGLNGGGGSPANTFLKISLSGFRNIKVKINGEVIAPGTYTVNTFTSFLNAMYICGGPNEIGTYRDIKLIRNNKIVSTLDLYDVITKGFSRGDMLLKDQDIIFVGPYVNRIAIDGSTKRVGLFEITSSEKLQDALSYAGGFDQYAYKDLVKLYRNNSNDKKIIDVKQEDLRNTFVQTGDSIYIDKILNRIENQVSIQGAVFRPGDYALESNPTLSKLIQSAQGLREESLQGRLNIIRTNDDLSISNISINYEDIISGKSSDISLIKRDKIMVPSMFDLTEESYIRIQGAINNLDAIEGVQIPYIKNMTIQDLIVKVGGLTEAASLSKVEIVRRKKNVDVKQVDAQISDVISFEIDQDLRIKTNQNEREKQILEPYDEVFIRTSPNYEKQNFVILRGEVLYPGKYGLKFKDEKISDIISRAGGLTPQSYSKGATLVRKSLLSDYQKEQREELITNLNLNTKIKKVKPLNDADVELDENGDPIETDINKTENEKTLKNTIIESVGIDLESIIKSPGSNEDLLLLNGDEIFIPKKLQTVRVQGEILYPTSVKYNPNLKFSDYISSSGGFTKKSASNKSFIIYPNGSVDRTRSLFFIRIYPKVQPGSEIIVPSKQENVGTQLAQASGIITTVVGALSGLVTIITILQLNKDR